MITLDQAALNLVSLIQCEKIQLTPDGAKAIVQASETILYLARHLQLQAVRLRVATCERF